MNRRITIFDQEDFKTNHLLWWSLPLGNEIYSVQTLEAMSPEEREVVLNVGEGDGVLVACGSGFNMIHERLHLGIRNENFSDCQLLPRLSAEGGAYLKCIPPEFPDDDTIKQFMSSNFTEHIDYIKKFNFRYKVLHTIEEAHRFLGWLEQQPEDTFFGYDVEASGMAIDRWFELSGLSICTLQYGGFISLTDIRHQVGKESGTYAGLIARIGAFLQSRMTHIWVYNMQYEYQVSFREFNVDLYDLCDAMAVNILDGFHLNKRFSLKFSSQRVLSVREWDSAFERISSLLESMLYTEVGTKKSERQKVLKVNQSNFKNTPEWNELCNRYPEYIEEFEQLILEYWGNAYMPIPSEILGKYCCLDSWYTLLLFESRRQTYSETCFNVFLDNLRLACQLHSCGVPKWEEYNTEYSNYCDTQMVWGILFCAASRCQIKMRKHQAKMADINKYNPICRILLEQRRFYNGDPLAITKDLLSSYLDEFDCTETGLDEGRLMLIFGDKFAEDFVSLVKDAMVEVKMKTKIDATIVRKKKILGIIAEGLITLLGLDKIKINNRHIELEKYIFYEKAYKELMSVYQKQVKDIEHVPETIYFEKTKFSRLEFADYVSEKYFKCKSPIENDEICLELAQLYSTETAYLAALKDGVHWMKGEKDYYKNLGITAIEDAFKHFQGEYTKAWNGTPIEQTGYPSKVYELFNEGYGALKKGKLTDSVKDIFSDFSGFETQENFFPYVKGQFLEYAKPFDPSDLDNNMFFLRKMVINYLLFKKYSKLKSSYTDSLFKKTDKLILEDPKTHVILREAGEEEKDNPNVKVRMIPAYECCMKSSKRWSGPYHVIPSHLDVKSVVRAYPGCLLSYFDISSAEVRAAAAQSKDAHLNELFNTRQDVYNFAAKLYVGEDKYEQLSKADKKKLRKNFKTVMLGVLYGLGKKSLAERLHCDVAEAERVILALYSAFPRLREYVKEQQDYIMEHEGRINSILGDRLVVPEWKYYLKAKQKGDQREMNSLVSRIQRLGVNLPIQGGTSALMSSGFFNDIRAAKQGLTVDDKGNIIKGEPWSLTSLITVHDSNTCNFRADKVFGLWDFYMEFFMKNVYKKSKMTLLFDLMIGTDYHSVTTLKAIDSKTIELTGTARALKMIANSMDECSELVYETDIPIMELQENYITHPIDRFIREKGCSMVLDKSEFTVRFHKLN